MRGYDDEYEDLDEYEEEDSEGQEVEEGGEEEYEEEEAPQPTQEELEYLELRQRLKEAIRKQRNKESISALANSKEKKNKLPNDNFGSFFGPSQPVIAQRVIQESKSLLENPHLAARISKPSHSNNKSSAPNPGVSKPRAETRPKKVTNGVKTKVQMLKNTRDYSFLLSDDSELPATSKNHPPSQKLSGPNSDARSAKVPPKIQQSSSNGRKVMNGREERNPAHTGRPMHHHKVGIPSTTKTSKPNPKSVDTRKQLGNNNGSGPGRPSGPKSLPSKIPVGTSEKKILAPGVKSSSMAGVRIPPPSKLQPSTPKPSLQPKKALQDSRKERVIPKQHMPSVKHQVKQPPAKNPSRPALQESRPKKKHARQYSDDEDAINMIRQMFKYNPNKYRDDDDDSDMEAGFDDILKEERRSALIAKREDEEELRKIEEEERRERLRMEAKRRKLSHK